MPDHEGGQDAEGRMVAGRRGSHLVVPSSEITLPRSYNERQYSLTACVSVLKNLSFNHFGDC
jgi:hypothetical protein